MDTVAMGSKIRSRRPKRLGGVTLSEVEGPSYWCDGSRICEVGAPPRSRSRFARDDISLGCFVPSEYASHTAHHVVSRPGTSRGSSQAGNAFILLHRSSDGIPPIVMQFGDGPAEFLIGKLDR